MKPSILVIEDDPISARLVELGLGSEGYQVVVAGNGLEGMKMALADPPDLILLDLMLPGVDGFEVLNRIRGNPVTADIPVVILSAKSQLTDKQTAVKIGAQAYLTKPYRKAELLEVVGSLLEGKPNDAFSSGTYVLVLGPQGGDISPVVAYVGLALASKGEKATIVDFRPFSVEHALALDVAPRLAPVELSDPKTVAQLPEMTVQHSSGLRLLNNLEGRGDAGQLTPEDVQTVVGTLLTKDAIVMAHFPLYASDVLRQAAQRCAMVLLVSRGAPALLAGARAALTLLERAGVDENRIGVVLVGPEGEDQLTELGGAALGVVPGDAGPGDPAFDVVAERLLNRSRAP